MSPVMARCRHSWPIAECTECAPPMLFAPAVPPDGGDPYGVVLDEVAPVAVTIAIGGVTAATVVVIGGVTVAAWVVGVAIDTLRRWP